MARSGNEGASAVVAPGYGMDLANICDITIASENAVFGSTQVKYAMNGFYHGLLLAVHETEIFHFFDPFLKRRSSCARSSRLG